MPVTAQATITYAVKSITIDGSGACSVLMSVTMGSQQLQAVLAQLDAAVCAPVWAGVPAPGLNRWADLKAELYTLLQAQGVIPV